MHGRGVRLARTHGVDWTTVYFRGGSLQGGGSRLRSRQYLQSGPVATCGTTSGPVASELHAGFAVAGGSPLAPARGLPQLAGRALGGGDAGCQARYSGQVATNLITNQLYFTNSALCPGRGPCCQSSTLPYRLRTSSRCTGWWHPTLRIQRIDVDVDSSAELHVAEHLPQFALTTNTSDSPAHGPARRLELLPQRAMLVIQDRFPEIDVGALSARRVSSGRNRPEGSQDSSRRSGHLAPQVVALRCSEGISTPRLGEGFEIPLTLSQISRPRFN